MKTIEDAKEWLESSLENNEAKIEARIILEKVLNLKSSDLINRSTEIISNTAIQKIKDIAKIRNEKKPHLPIFLKKHIF